MTKIQGRVVKLDRSGLRQLEQVLEQHAGTQGKSNLSRKAGIDTSRMAFQGLGRVFVQMDITRFQHNLGVHPAAVIVCPMEDATVWMALQPTHRLISLQASSDDVPAWVCVLA